MSALSVLGSIFIIITFLKWSYFRKPINRLVFYTAFGNLLGNIATFMGTSAIPNAHELTPVCEFQGILIQWFMAADSFLVFSMALNVQLVFFHGYTSVQLRLLEKWYLFCAYGVPAITAIAYICIDHLTNTKVIGPGILYCWLSPDVAWMRIAFVYTPIWLVILSTLGIYLVIGLRILCKGSKFQSLSKKVTTDREPENVLHGRHMSADLPIKVETKMETHFEPQSSHEIAVGLSRSGSHSSFGSTRQLSTALHAQTASAHPGHFPGSIYDGNAQNGYRATAFATDRLDIETDPYHSVSMPNDSITGRPSYLEVNVAAWNYFKVALLMFVALVCVWFPSTINRLQQFIHKDKALFGLYLGSALGLPLQGFWNSVIYISTTWLECKRATAEVVALIPRRRCSSPSTGNPQTMHADESPLEFGAVIPLAEFTNSRPPELHQSPETPASKDMPSTNVTISK
ncbi:hypothetical protein DM02DRAFT_536455 [Periconia macrospinosa]|uniref:G-protein coupled receptors family 2 profile 2 domain-containing protein n=1 Tax=Periconia macrospinosa TaxID=97972 RepID=A0A2V1DCN9_9PLEO|nr:hypothetical protein DM02DRAFT_536455 [Periconia macrospinosa]